MQKKSSQSFFWIYLLIVTLELLSNFWIEELPWFHYMVKPIVMISLGIWFWNERKGQLEKQDKWMLLAIVFSLFGDIFLMLKGASWFIPGLGSFLVAQLLYAVVFVRQGGGLLKRQPWWILLGVSYAALLLYLIWGGLGELLIPVIIYALAICTMVLAALNRKGGVSKMSYLLVLIGALLFLISDSVIGLSRFATFDVPQHKTIIMASYMAAQYLIIKGYLSNSIVA